MSKLSVYDFEVPTISGAPQKFSQYKDQVLLIVNTASKCGFTSQYAELEEIYQKYKSQNFMVLGFPCNQFGAQESGTNSEIEAFCSLNFGVTFPLFSKIDVNGPKAHPLFQFLKSECKGLLGTEFIKWNFTKFLVDRKGNVVSRFAPQVKPKDIENQISTLLTSFQ